MHELSIAVSLVEAAGEAAAKRDAASVSAVYLRLGLLSGVQKEALLFSYDLATEGTPLEGSRLMIQEAPVVVFLYRVQRPATHPFSCSPFAAQPVARRRPMWSRAGSWK